MSFNPSSTIFLCNVDFDKTYKNVRYFENREARDNYFFSHVVKTFGAYYVVRDNPDGGRVSSVKVEANIETLRSLPCNYMFYQNANHGTRYFYAFITGFKYISENSTEIFFEQDVFQTWFHDVDLMPSYVVREHAASDSIGENTVPEQFNVEDYKYTHIDSEQLNGGSWGYLVGSTETLNASDPKGTVFSGIYQGLYFYFYPEAEVQALNNFLVNLEESGNDSIVFIAVVPEFNVSLNWLGMGGGLLFASEQPRSTEVYLDVSDAGKKFGNYTPKNNKLHTYPFESLICTNHSGQEVEYKLEDFSSRNELTFIKYGDVSSNPSQTLIPLNYQGIGRNYDAGISITGFPQCAFNSDTFKLWLAKNSFGIAAESVMNVGKIIGGVAALAGTAATAGASAPVTGVGGVALIASGASGIAGTISNVQAASKEPNRTAGGGAKNNLLTAMGFNKFDFYMRRIKEGHARTIDDYFTMFGYQTNRVKVPNVNVRKAFTYVQTMDVNIMGSIPNDDMIILKNIFNQGVTLWKSQCAVGNYTVDNGVI